MPQAFKLNLTHKKCFFFKIRHLVAHLSVAHNLHAKAINFGQARSIMHPRAYTFFWMFLIFLLIFSFVSFFFLVFFLIAALTPQALHTLAHIEWTYIWALNCFTTLNVFLYCILEYVDQFIYLHESFLVNEQFPYSPLKSLWWWGRNTKSWNKSAKKG